MKRTENGTGEPEEVQSGTRCVWGGRKRKPSSLKSWRGRIGMWSRQKLSSRLHRRDSNINRLQPILHLLQFITLHLLHTCSISQSIRLHSRALGIVLDQVPPLDRASLGLMVMIDAAGSLVSLMTVHRLLPAWFDVCMSRWARCSVRIGLQTKPVATHRQLAICAPRPASLC